MTKFKRILLVTVAAVLALSAAARSTSTVRVPNLFNNVDEVAMNQWVDSVFNSLSADARIGQLIVAAVTPRSNDATRELVRSLVTRNLVGGLIYENSTIAEQAEVTNLAQSLATVPLMITIDGEWGLGMRLKDVPNFPRNLILGAIDNDMLLYEYGREVARQCRRMGIQVNFAPVLDVNDNPLNPVIGDRSFGESPELVARHAIAFGRGLEWLVKRGFPQDPACHQQDVAGNQYLRISTLPQVYRCRIERHPHCPPLNSRHRWRQSTHEPIQ